MANYNRRKKPESYALSPPQLLRNHIKTTSSVQSQDFSESRLSSLKQILHSIYAKILDDPMMKVLSNDNISSEFITTRVNEIFYECIENEREAYYSNLFEKYLNENLSLRDELLQVFISFFLLMLSFS